MLLYNEKNLIKMSLVAFAMWLFLFANLGGDNAKSYYKVTSIVDSVGVWDFGSWDDGKRLSSDITHDLDYYIHRAVCLHNNTRNNDIRKSLEEQIAEEKRLGEIELLAQLVEAEAGNQDLKGKRLVSDVVLNRLEERWGDSIEQIIFDDGQFSCINDGGFEKAGWNISEESYEAARMEYEAGTGKRLDNVVLYFTAGGYNKYCKPMYKYGSHYFGN